MRLIKLFGFAMLTSVIAMALIGTSIAAANDTVLCKVHELNCAPVSQVEELHMNNTAGTVLTVLNSVADVLCLTALLKAEVGPLGAPQALSATALTFGSCGTNAAHNNCLVGTIELPEFSLLRTVLNLGTLTTEEGIINVKCTILGFVKINCDYDLNGLAFPMEGALHKGVQTGHGMLTALNKGLAPLEGLGGVACPTASSLDFLLEPSEHTYIVE